MSAHIVDHVVGAVDVEQRQRLAVSLDDATLARRPSPPRREPHSSLLSHSRLSRSPPPSRALLDRPPPEAVAGVVVHHASGMHESVPDRRSAEPEAAPDQIPAHGPRGVRLGGPLAPPAPGVLHGVPADELPDKGVEAPVLAPDRQERTRVGDRRFDLRPVADDARVLHEAPDPGVGVADDLARVEAIERRAVRGALSQDRRPAQPRLRPLQNQELEEPSVLVERHAPLSVVIADLERSPSPRAPALVHRLTRDPMVLLLRPDGGASIDPGGKGAAPRPSPRAVTEPPRPGPSRRSRPRPYGRGVSARGRSRRARPPAIGSRRRSRRSS